MIRAFFAACAVVLLGITTFAADDKPARHFGAPFSDARIVSLKDAMGDVAKYSGKVIKIEGEIRDVCQEKGCWLMITDGERAMRVTFKDYGFFVPKDSAGNKVTIEGMIERKTITEEHAQHIASESKDKIDPKTIKGPQEVVTMVATGVSIK